jgi:hypothetical protein
VRPAIISPKRSPIPDAPPVMARIPRWGADVNEFVEVAFEVLDACLTATSQSHEDATVWRETPDSDRAKVSLALTRAMESNPTVARILGPVVESRHWITAGRVVVTNTAASQVYYNENGGNQTWQLLSQFAGRMRRR